MPKNEKRVKITLACEDCKGRNYITMKSRGNDRLPPGGGGSGKVPGGRTVLHWDARDPRHRGGDPREAAPAPTGRAVRRRSRARRRARGDAARRDGRVGRGARTDLARARRA